MVTILKQMLDLYECKTLEDEKNAVKEIMQEIALAGLAKSDFFKKCAFYGGTALRIFYDLERFSEDLNFTLLTTDEHFSLEPYYSFIQNTVESLGLRFEIYEKEKQGSSTIKSAFLKGNAKEHYLIFYPNSRLSSLIQSGEKIQIKFEIDLDPPSFASTELKYRLLPYPYQVRIYDKPSLFAGKIHAIIARNWKTRVKGRDFYDYVFYLATNTPVNLIHLEARLKQTNSIDPDLSLTIESLKKMLYQRFAEIDFDAVKKDVYPFIKDVHQLDLWSVSFFQSITEGLSTVDSSSRRDE